MEINKVNIREKLNLFNDHWNPRIVGELNRQHIKSAKFQGEFVWHDHDNEDEMFLVWKAVFPEGTTMWNMELRDKNITMNKGDFIIIRKGIERKPPSEKKVQIMLFESATTLNTGNILNSELTKNNLEKI